MQLTDEALATACADEAFDSGLMIHGRLEPIAGRGAPVKPAIYAGGQYQLDTRWVDGDDHPVRVVIIDNVPSEANRAEAALRQLGQRAGLPQVELDLSSAGPLPPHLPTRLSGLSFPHRSADAYLRDALLDGQPFPRTEVGRALLAASGENPRELLRWFPQALLYGFWTSHAGKKASQTKLARSWVSEIVGVAPGTTETRTLGLKGDPLNLNVDNAVAFDEDFVEGWQVAEDKRGTGAGRKKDGLSAIGHGQVPVGEGLAAISFRDISQQATVSFAALRRIDAGAPDANAAARALLVALGVLGHVAAFHRSFSLRSGCELRTVSSTWTWLGETPSGDTAVDAPSLDQALDLFRACADRAHAAGLPVGPTWRDGELALAPNAELAKVIRASYPAEA